MMDNNNRKKKKTQTNKNFIIFQGKKNKIQI